MPVTAAGGVYRARVAGDWRLGIEFWQNTFHIARIDREEPSEALMEDWADALHTAYGAFLTALSGQWRKLETTFKRVDDADAPTAHYPDVLTGSGAGSVLPAQVALVVSFRHQEGNLTPHYGRVYLNGFIATQVDSSGMWTQARVDAVEATYAALCDALQALDSELVIMSYNTPTTGTARPVTAVGVGLRPDTQRRRAKSIPEGTTFTAV